MAYAGNVAHGIATLLAAMRADVNRSLNGEVLFLTDGTPKKSIYHLAENLFGVRNDCAMYVSKHELKRMIGSTATDDSGVGQLPCLLLPL